MNEREKRLQELLESALSGGAADYREFLDQLAAHLRSFFRRRLTRLQDEVEDLVQETLLAVHLQRHTYDPAQPLTAWLHAIARYKLVDLLRRRARGEMLNDPLDDEREFLAEPEHEAALARRDVAVLLEQLPDRHRLPIVYTRLEGRSVAETAKLTGMSESAVKVGVHRGLKALAARLRKLP